LESGASKIFVFDVVLNIKLYLQDIPVDNEQRS